jgi:hypothetical protein
MIIEGFDTEKIKADAAAGLQIKVKAANQYRPATLLGVGRRKKDGALMVKARISPANLPCGTYANEVDFYPMCRVRKEDKKRWTADNTQ